MLSVLRRKSAVTSPGRSPGSEGGSSYCRTVSPSPVRVNRVAYCKRPTLTYSGGTAPVLHRTSLLSPCGRPRKLKASMRAARPSIAGRRTFRGSLETCCAKTALVSLFQPLARLRRHLHAGAPTASQQGSTLKRPAAGFTDSRTSRGNQAEPLEGLHCILGRNPS